MWFVCDGDSLVQLYSTVWEFNIHGTTTIFTPCGQKYADTLVYVFVCFFYGLGPLVPMKGNVNSTAYSYVFQTILSFQLCGDSLGKTLVSTWQCPCAQSQLNKEMVCGHSLAQRVNQYKRNSCTTMTFFLLSITNAPEMTFLCYQNWIHQRKSLKEHL